MHMPIHLPVTATPLASSTVDARLHPPWKVTVQSFTEALVSSSAQHNHVCGCQMHQRRLALRQLHTRDSPAPPCSGTMMESVRVGQSRSQPTSWAAAYPSIVID
ncbi:hypothetical protein DPSP01_000097 [Paraphaeosphaeria sporulosa]